MTQEALRQLTAKNKKSLQGKQNSAGEKPSPDDLQKPSTLIEFPGTTRSMPEWRKQLSQRVREVQERKAREAAEELAAAQEAGLVSCALPSGQLELVPDLEQPLMNPIVSKALERIDRARRNEFSASPFTATATAPALAPEADLFPETEIVEAPVSESKPKLTVVPQPLVDADPVVAAAEIDPAATAEMETDATSLQPERKAVRVISDNDACLSYLETCLSVPPLAADSRQDLASVGRRTVAGIFDLLLIGLMVAPVAAAIDYSGGNWLDPRVIGTMAGITAATMFAYLTISTALTGRTLAMRMFSLRTIDLRTGLIPTGGQSIKRAAGYVVGLAFAGLGLAYALIDPDQRTIHDRFSHTIVIRD